MTAARPYQLCTRCVMDTTDEEIVFDARGHCNHCEDKLQRMAQIPASKGDAPQRLQEVVAAIKADQRGEYDSLVGLSGGVDSSYVAWQAVKLGLRPLAVHFDNGWNSELAVRNIEEMVKRLGLDLVTYVIDWPEFKDIQRSFFKAHVLDIEMVTDHAIFAAMFRLAREHRIRHILSGTNVATEAIMPRTWQHFKFDLLNLRAIHRKFGTRPIRNYPTISIWRMAWERYGRGIGPVSILNYLPYRKTQAIATLETELGWKYYGGKHYESIFTKFYQSFLLPAKFNIDKRRIHFSDLIINGEMTRDAALEELQRPIIGQSEAQEQLAYVCKKLGFSPAEMQEYLQAPAVSHFAYPSYARIAQRLVGIYRRTRYR
jgi:N-acetyl sugar amidotransferase